MIPFAASARRYSEWLTQLVETGSNVLFPDIHGKELARTLIEGEMMLSIPVKGGASVLKRKGLTDAALSGHGRWQDVHLGALRASYGKTPYFIHLYPEIESIYNTLGRGGLKEFNRAFHDLICRRLDIDKDMIEVLRTLPDTEKERIRRIGEEKRAIIDMNHSILEVLFRLGKEGLFVLL